MKIFKKVLMILVLMLVVFLFGTAQEYVKNSNEDILTTEIQRMIDESVQKRGQDDMQVMLSIINYLQDRIEVLEEITGVTDE